jgi:hypothetical protein
MKLHHVLQEDKADPLKIANEIISFLKSKPEGRQVHGSDIQKAEMVSGEASASIRHWGKWVTPPDADDDEDYDWQELSQESGKKLKEYLDDIKKRYPNSKIYVSTGEKNWIEIQVK